MLREITLSSLNRKVLFLLALVSTSAFAQPDTSSFKADEIIAIAKTLHVAPEANNSAFSDLVFNEWIELLDPYNTFFTSEDLESLEPFRSYAGHGGDSALTVIRKASEVYSKRYHNLRELLEKESTHTLNLNSRNEYRSYTSIERLNENEWQQHWKDYFKLRVYLSIYSSMDSTQKSSLPTSSVVSEYQSKTSEHLLCNLETKIEQPELIEEYVSEKYLKALAKGFDPHTNYFSNADFQQFSTALSSNTYSFGMEVYRNEIGDIEVYNIAPGSPAWNSQEINTGDLITQAEVDGQRIEDFSCMSMSEVRDIVELGDHTSATFTIRKQNGEVVTLDLTKARIQVEDNTIESFILEGEQRIGYIYLPVFYGDEDYLGCAVDVSKALIRLKREGVDGLIFDLRNNGGGSMYEAIRMAGAFVDRGALGIYSNGEPPYETIKDPDRGAIFRQPMVVLVNSFSASASELFAAAMQDHNRALIVGSTTYGKATSQQVLPLIAEPNEEAELFDGSYLKLTTGAFYRVTGVSHQGVGIVPDIELPQDPAYSAYSEAAYPSVLQREPIVKKTYYTPASPLPIEQLRLLSKQRIEGDSTWMEIATGDTTSTINSIPLNFSEFVEYMAVDEEPLLESNPSTSSSIFEVAPLSSLMKFASQNEDSNNRIIQRLKKDPYVEESFLILIDLLHNPN